MTINELTKAWECVPRRGIPNSLPAATLLWHTPKDRYKVDGEVSRLKIQWINKQKKKFRDNKGM